MRLRKAIVSFLSIVGLFILLAGCSGVTSEKEKNPTDKSVESESPSNIFANEPQQSLGSFSFGPVSDNDEDERDIYEFNGKDIRIPFQVAGTDKGVNSEFGLLVFLDGVPQPYRIEESNGTSSKEQIMHKFHLEGEESKQFEIVFTPITGKKGEKVAIDFASVFKPDYVPEDETATNYGVYHNLNATLPQEVYFKTDIPNLGKHRIYSQSNIQEIPEEIKGQNDFVQMEETTDIFDEMTVTELLPEDESSEMISAKNGKAKMKFRIYGGPEVTYRTTIFINHIPVKVLDSDFIETSIQKGKMNTVEFELDTSTYGKINTVYAISVVSGKGYLANPNSPLKTKSMLLLNES